jgi:uncharacterized protein (DUF1800 family)
MATIDRDQAAHLLRRMGFGGPPEDIDDLVSRGSREAAVDFLINYESINNQAMEDVLDRSFNWTPPLDNTKINQNEIRRRWFVRMILSKRQFEEKMTLFWHNHFATAISKVNNEVYMQVQNDTLRKYALGRFDDLLLKVAQDPAMLIWLDTLQNVKGKTNENFARELQELFTMGIFDVVTGEKNYSEDDIKEIARAFTGWNFVRPNANQPFVYAFRRNDANHDAGSKTIYSGTPFQTTGNLDGTDVIDVIARRPATPRYLVKKLFEFFVYPLDLDSSADRATADRFAKVYLNNNHSIKELARAIFTSDEFFSDRAFYALVKTPVEFVVEPIRMLGAQFNPGGPTDGRDNSQYIRSAQLGMDVFNPPDVSGWDLNVGFINTALMLARYNMANTFATTRPASVSAPGAGVTLDQLKRYTRFSAKKTVNNFLSVLNVSTDKQTQTALRNYLGKDDAGNPVTWDPSTDAVVDKKIRGLMHLIMSLPEFSTN